MNPRGLTELSSHTCLHLMFSNRMSQEMEQQSLGGLFLGIHKEYHHLLLVYLVCNLLYLLDGLRDFYSKILVLVGFHPLVT